MAVLIDTDLLVDLEHGVGAPEVDRLLGEEERAISVITVSELCCMGYMVREGLVVLGAARLSSIFWRG